MPFTVKQKAGRAARWILGANAAVRGRGRKVPTNLDPDPPVGRETRESDMYPVPGSDMARNSDVRRALRFSLTRDQEPG
jgi:hypothetical protein